MARSREILALVAVIVTLLLATGVVAQEAPTRLDNPHRWPCPPGYEAYGSLACRRIRGFAPEAEMRQSRAQALHARFMIPSRTRVVQLHPKGDW